MACLLVIKGIQLTWAQTFPILGLPTIHMILETNNGTFVFFTEKNHTQTKACVVLNSRPSLFGKLQRAVRLATSIMLI